MHRSSRRERERERGRGVKQTVDRCIVLYVQCIIILQHIMVSCELCNRPETSKQPSTNSYQTKRKIIYYYIILLLLLLLLRERQSGRAGRGMQRVYPLVPPCIFFAVIFLPFHLIPCNVKGGCIYFLK